MAGLAKSMQYLWAVSVTFECLLLAFMVIRRHYRSYAAFFSYIVIDLLQALGLFAVYQIWGFLTYPTMYFAWSSQALVICARAFAVAELCRHLLKEFRGIWALAWRLLLLCAAIVATISASLAGWSWYKTILRMNVGLELAMITVIVCLFLFARYYQVVAEPVLRTMAVGFFVLSCSKIVNDTILQQWLVQYVDLWRPLGMVAFFGSLSLWFSALYKEAPVPAPRKKMLPPDIYGSLSPKINERLRGLNEQLNRFWHLKARSS